MWVKLCLKDIRLYAIVPQRNVNDTHLYSLLNLKKCFSQISLSNLGDMYPLEGEGKMKRSSNPILDEEISLITKREYIWFMIKTPALYATTFSYIAL